MHDSMCQALGKLLANDPVWRNQRYHLRCTFAISIHPAVAFCVRMAFCCWSMLAQLPVSDLPA